MSFVDRSVLMQNTGEPVISLLRNRKMIVVFCIYMSAIAAVNLLSGKLVATSIVIGGVNLLGWLPGGVIKFSSGAFCYAITFPMTDVLSEIWGKRTARLAVWCGLGANIGIMAYTMLAIQLPAADPEYQAAFVKVLGSSVFIIGGYLLSYTISQLSDVWLYHKIREGESKPGFESLWKRILGSTLVSQALDTAIFIPVAFYLSGQITDFNELLLVMGCQYLVKACMTVFILPSCYLLVYWVGYNNELLLPEEDYRAHLYKTEA